MNKPNFWNDKKNSENIINELNNLKNKKEKIENLKAKINNNLEMLDILKNEYDEEIKNILESDIELITKDMNDL